MQVSISVMCHSVMKRTARVSITNLSNYNPKTSAIDIGQCITKTSNLGLVCTFIYNSIIILLNMSLKT